MANRGSVTLDVNIDGKNFRQQFLVLEGLTTSVICGVDFLRDHRAVVDMAGGTIIFNGTMSIPLIRKKEYVGIARISADTKILEGTSQEIPVTVQGGGYRGEVQLLSIPDQRGGLKLATKSCTAVQRNYRN